jgi:3-phosphoshikimate 1-carboxyvinyltransferase
MSRSRVQPAGPLRGTLRPPPDKSISHRAALLAAMAPGRTVIDSYLAAADTEATLAAIAALGAEVRAREDGGRETLEVSGVGLRGAGPARIDVGNAGTLIRLLPGWLAGQGEGRGPWSLDGDESIRTRPVDRVVEPLRLMGANVSCRDGRVPPISVEGAQLRGTSYRLPVASAQVKSCLLLAGLLAEGVTEVIEPLPTRDHTERMLAAAGAELSRSGDSIRVRAAEALEPGRIAVPGDLSAAAFPLAAALIVPGSEVVLEGVGVNPTRDGLLHIVERMGGKVERQEENDGTEPVATLVARHSQLRGTTVTASEVPLAIDELPLVALLGCFAEGETVVEGAAELRHKESDRIDGVVGGLQGLGARIEARPDGFAVGGGGLRGGTLDARADHRLAMLGAIAGVASAEGVEVHGSEAAEVSYPGFEADLTALLG